MTVGINPPEFALIRIYGVHEVRDDDTGVAGGNSVLRDVAGHEHRHASSSGIILGDPKYSLGGGEIVAGRPLDDWASLGSVETSDTHSISLHNRFSTWNGALRSHGYSFSCGGTDTYSLRVIMGVELSAMLRRCSISRYW
jgi:hypothetical protein